MWQLFDIGKLHRTSGGNELLYWLNISSKNICAYKAPSNYCEWFVSSEDAIFCQERRLCLICVAYIAVRFCHRKDALSDLVIRQLSVQQWTWCSDMGSWALEIAFTGRVDVKVLCPGDPLPSPLYPVRNLLKFFFSSSTLWGWTRFGAWHWSWPQWPDGR